MGIHSRVPKLSLVLRNGAAVPVAKLVVVLTYTVFARGILWFKKQLRPVYHSLFGARLVSKSSRI